MKLAKVERKSANCLMCIGLSDFLIQNDKEANVCAQFPRDFDCLRPVSMSSILRELRIRNQIRKAEFINIPDRIKFLAR